MKNDDKQTYRKYGYTFLGIFIIFVLFFYLPNILFLCVKNGIVTLVKPTTIDVTIKLPEGWFALASSESLSGKVFIPHAEPKTVLFYKNNWVTPWASEMLIVSQQNLNKELENNYQKNHIIKNYNIVPIAGLNKKRTNTYIFPEFNLSLTRSGLPSTPLPLTIEHNQ